MILDTLVQNLPLDWQHRLLPLLARCGFENPAAAGLLYLIPLYWGTELLFFRRHKVPYILHPAIAGLKPSIWNPRYLKILLRSLVMMLLIGAFASPIFTTQKKKINATILDLMLVFDLSASMQITDFSPNRFIVARKVIHRFIQQRQYDLIGLVGFSGEAYLASPLTSNYEALLFHLTQFEPGMLPPGTAIGDAIVTALNGLRTSVSKSKVIILLTDGDSNVGRVQPLQAANLAQKMGVRIHTIALGEETTNLVEALELGDNKLPSAKEGFIPSVNLPLLNKLSALTGGKMFVAKNSTILQDIFAELNRLEKTLIEIENIEVKQRGYPYLICLALILLAAISLLDEFKWREQP